MLKVVVFCLQLWFARLTVAYVYDVTSTEGPNWILFNTVQCGETTCSITTQDCFNDEVCVCKPDFEYRDDGHCHICPGEGHACTGCCLGEADCFQGRCQRCWKDQSGKCIPQDSLFFLTAAQVALATAMVIGVSALATLMYKTFRSRSRNNRQQILESELHRTGSSRISLSSIQIRVLRRLRDRPPKYETRHNYEFHQREQTADTGGTEQPRPTTTPIGEQARTPPVIGAPPPAYDGDVASLVDFPPPYTADPPHPDARIAIIDEQRSREFKPEEGTGPGGTVPDAGIVNEAYENTERSDAKIEGSTGIDVGNNEEHKTIHI